MFVYMHIFVHVVFSVSIYAAFCKWAFLFHCCRMMYWSVIGDHSHIEESAMDGSLRRVLLEKNLRRPTGWYLGLYYFCNVTFLLPCLWHIESALWSFVAHKEHNLNINCIFHPPCVSLRLGMHVECISSLMKQRVR